MNFVEEAAALFDGFAPSRVSDCGKVADSGWEIASIDKLSIFGGGGNVHLIAKAVAAEYVMEFKRVE